MDSALVSGVPCLKRSARIVFVELQLRGIERHHVDGNTAGEEFLRGGDVAVDVVFRLRAVVGRVAEVAVAFADRAAHDDDAIEFLEGGRIAIDGGADVGERTDGDERDVAGIFADLVEEEIDGLRVGFWRDGAAFCPLRLAEYGDWAFVGMPSATGIFVALVSASRRSIICARSWVSPHALEMPRIWTSGLMRARPMAKTSSTSSPSRSR